VPFRTVASRLMLERKIGSSRRSMRPAELTLEESFLYEYAAHNSVLRVEA